MEWANVISWRTMFAMRTSRWLAHESGGKEISRSARNDSLRDLATALQHSRDEICKNSPSAYNGFVTRQKLLAVASSAAFFTPAQQDRAGGTGIRHLKVRFVPRFGEG